MKRFQFVVAITATPEQVWKHIITQDSFKEWTSAFAEGSYFEGSWEEGETIRFLKVNEEGLKEGMVGVIEKNEPFRHISIKHIGWVVKGEDDTSVEWAPAYENYTLEETEQGTKLIVDADILEEYEEMFTRLWPKALDKLKTLAEKQN